MDIEYCTRNNSAWTYNTTLEKANRKVKIWALYLPQKYAFMN